MSPQKNINNIVEFCDKNEEREYFDLYISRSSGFNLRLVLISAVVFFVFILCGRVAPDDGRLKLISLGVRAAVLVSAVITRLVIRRERHGRISTIYLTIYEMIFATGIIALISNLEPSNILNQSILAILFIIYCFSTPNRWIYQMLLALYMIAQYIFISVFLLGGDEWLRLLETTAYLVLAFAISGIYARRIHFYQRKQFAREGRLEVVSNTDRLTRIYNRQKFDEVLQQWIKLKKETSESFSLIMFDLDNYKRYNDTYGHLAGDNALVNVARLVKGCIRNHDIFARWGGEEFIILLPFTSILHASELAERLRAALSSGVMDTGQTITASFGVTEFRDGDTHESVMERVDSFLYQAKSEGKNRVVSG